MTRTSIFLGILLTLMSSQNVTADKYIERISKHKLYSVEGLIGGLIYGQRLKHRDYKLKPKSQLVVSLAVNRQISNNIALFSQLINQFWTQSTGRYTQHVSSYNVKHYYRNVSLLFGGTYNFSFTKFIPYIKAGIGIASNRSYETHTKTTGVNFEGKYLKTTKNNLAYLIGIGIKKKIYSNSDLLLEYNYFDAGKATTSKLFYNGINTTQDSPLTYKIRNHYILAGISYKF